MLTLHVKLVLILMLHMLPSHSLDFVIQDPPISYTTNQFTVQCLSQEKKKKKTQSIKKSTKVTLKFSVNMSSPTLMFGNFFGTWGWWGTISRLTCPATGLLVRGHPAHASTGSSAQLRVEI